MMELEPRSKPQPSPMALGGSCPRPIRRALGAALLFLVLLKGGGAAAVAWTPPQSSDQLRTLAGWVLSSREEPLQKAVVYLKNTKTLAIKTYITDAKGGYHFPALSPNVDYELYAEFNGDRSDTKTLSSFDNRKQVNITLKIHAPK